MQNRKGVIFIWEISFAIWANRHGFSVTDLGKSAWNDLMLLMENWQEGETVWRMA